MKIGKRIEKLRKARWLGVRDLARLSEVAPGQISRIELSPRPNPTLDTLLRIAKGLNVHITELFR